MKFSKLQFLTIKNSFIFATNDKNAGIYMKKVIIIGCPGSGKSTFARKLSAITGLPLYHLDMMYWNKDRTTVEKDVFVERLRNAMSEDMWIIDGNYNSTMEMRLKECDTVFFLDYLTQICIDGIESRRGKARSDIPWVENNDVDVEFVEFVNRFNSDSRPGIIGLLEKYSSKNIMIFRSRNESEEHLNLLKEEK